MNNLEVNVTIDFVKVNGIFYDSNNKDLIKATDKTMEALCKTIEKYFNDKKIQVNCKYERKNEK